MAAGFERSGTVLTVHLPTELDHPVSDEIRRESDRIIGHEYIKNMIFDFSETVFYGQLRHWPSYGTVPCIGNERKMCAGNECKQSYRKASASFRSWQIY